MITKFLSEERAIAFIDQWRDTTKALVACGNATGDHIEALQAIDSMNQESAIEIVNAKAEYFRLTGEASEGLEALALEGISATDNIKLFRALCIMGTDEFVRIVSEVISSRRKELVIDLMKNLKRARNFSLLFDTDDPNLINELPIMTMEDAIRTTDSVALRCVYLGSHGEPIESLSLMILRSVAHAIDTIGEDVWPEMFNDRMTKHAQAIAKITHKNKETLEASAVSKVSGFFAVSTVYEA